MLNSWDKVDFHIFNVSFWEISEGESLLAPHIIQPQFRENQLQGFLLSVYFLIFYIHL